MRENHGTASPSLEGCTRKHGQDEPAHHLLDALVRDSTPQLCGALQWKRLYDLGCSRPDRGHFLASGTHKNPQSAEAPYSSNGRSPCAERNAVQTKVSQHLHRHFSLPKVELCTQVVGHGTCLPQFTIEHVLNLLQRPRVDEVKA